MNERTRYLASLCRQYQIAILYAFGSRAKEVLTWLQADTAVLSASPSDIDIGFKAGRGVSLSTAEKVALMLALEDFFDVPRVDLVDLAQADPFLAANVIRGERLYAQDSYQADEFDLYILRRAGDLAPLERERMALILGK